LKKEWRERGERCGGVSSGIFEDAVCEGAEGEKEGVCRGSKQQI